MALFQHTPNVGARGWTQCARSLGGLLAAQGLSRRLGSAGRYQAGIVCLIAWYATYRLAGVLYLPESTGSLPGGHSVLDSWEHYCSPADGEPQARIYWSLPAGTVCLFAGIATTRWAGGEPPAWTCWARPGRHSVPDRWESCDSLA